MANKGPQTQKGKERKLSTGDGRKNPPWEKVEKAIRSADDATARVLGSKKKTTKTKAKKR